MNRRPLWIRFFIILAVLAVALAALYVMDHKDMLPSAKPAMYIEPAEDRALRNESFQQTYEFRFDGQLKSVLLEIWELKDGQWESFGNGRIAVSDNQGKFTLAFNELTESVTYALQSQSFTYSIGKNFATNAAAIPGNIMYTTMQTQLKEAVYDTPIPVAMQIYTPNRNAQFIGTDLFHQPELLASEGHDHVYAVTLTFSQTSME